MKIVERKPYQRPCTDMCREAFPVSSLLIKSIIVAPGIEVDDEAAKEFNVSFDLWDDDDTLPSSDDDHWP